MAKYQQIKIKHLPLLLLGLLILIFTTPIFFIHKYWDKFININLFKIKK